MARRRSKSGGDLLGILIIFGMLVLALVLFIIQITLTIILHAAPFVLVGAYFYFKNCRVGKPSLPRIVDFDLRTETAAATALEAQIRRLRGEHKRLHAEGQSLKLEYRSGNSQDPRFDQRSKKGKELNRKLDEVSSAEAGLSADLSSLKSSVMISLPGWEATFGEWIGTTAAKRAIEHAAIAYGGTLAVVSMITLIWNYEGIGNLVTFDLLPDFLYIPACLAAFAAGGTFYLSRNYAINTLAPQTRSEFWDEWSDTYSRWTCTSVSDDNAEEPEPAVHGNQAGHGMKYSVSRLGRRRIPSRPPGGSWSKNTILIASKGLAPS